MVDYEYKVVSIPRTFSIKYDEDAGVAVANYLTELINNLSEEGWEFYRADGFSAAQTPGCIASLLGAQPHFQNYNVATFRKVKP